MPNVSHTIIAKSDQLNFDDIRSGEKILEITTVNVTAGDQPVSIHYKDDLNKPYKPCKGMIRLICEAWGEESENWHGKSLKLYGEDSVRWAGAEIGGLRIRAMSDIDPRGMSSYVAVTRGKRRKVTIEYLKPQPIQKHVCPKCKEKEVTFIEKTKMWTCGKCAHAMPPVKPTQQGNK
jgi:ribosomal protein L37AE/L43A